MKHLSDRATWPTLKFEVQVFPWHWRIKPYLYRDDIESWYTFEWFAFRIELGWNRPMFTEREESSNGTVPSYLLPRPPGD